MSNLLLQVQLLLAALSALLPLVPDEYRARAGEILDIAARALTAIGVVTANLGDLAAKLADVRREVEAMAGAGRAVSADELDAAMARVRTASNAFRVALAEAGAG